MNFQDRFETINTLGGGGMGDVFLVFDKIRNTEVVLKRLKPELIRPKDLSRFRREFNIINSIKHPNIVEVYDSFLDEATPSFSMKYYRNGDVSNLIANIEKNEKLIIKYSKEILSALAYIHSLSPKIFHRDLKPGNILVGDDGCLKLSDFGLSRASNDSTVTSSNWGSHGFTAPEQLEDMHSVDESADLYSLGAIIYYFYTGSIPGYFGNAVFDKILSPTLSAIVAALLVHSPWERTRHASHVISAIDRLYEITESTGSEFEYSRIVKCQKCGELAIRIASKITLRRNTEITECVCCDFKTEQQVSRR